MDLRKSSPNPPSIAAQIIAIQATQALRSVRGGKAVRAFPDGTLCFSRHYRGTIGGSLDLHEFPLDRHTLEVDLEESIFEADQVVFVPAGEQGSACGNGGVKRFSSVHVNCIVSNLRRRPRSMACAEPVKLV